MVGKKKKKTWMCFSNGFKYAPRTIRQLKFQVELKWSNAQYQDPINYNETHKLRIQVIKKSGSSNRRFCFVLNLTRLWGAKEYEGRMRPRRGAGLTQEHSRS